MAAAGLRPSKPRKNGVFQANRRRCLHPSPQAKSPIDPAPATANMFSRFWSAHMDDWVLRMPWPGAKATESEPLLTREWLVTNGLGGFASGTVGGVASRRYHGLLIAALPSPLGRWVMLNH